MSKKRLKILSTIIQCLIMAILVCLNIHTPFCFVYIILIGIFVVSGVPIKQTFCRDGIVLHRVLLPNKVIYWYEISQLDLARVNENRKRFRNGVEIKSYMVYAKIENFSRVLILTGIRTSVQKAVYELQDIIQEYPFLMDRFISTGLNDLEKQEFEEILAKIKYSYN